MSEEDIRAYVAADGKLFRISNIDFYRDGGTGVIQTNAGVFFIHHKTSNVHTGYPCCDENLIDTDLEKRYLLEQMRQYIDRQQEDVNRYNALLAKIK